MATTLHTTDFGKVRITDRGLGFNLAQNLGKYLWLPMWLMAIMAFPVALVLGIVRAGLVAQNAQPATVAALGHFVPAAMFLGFASVLAAIAFAIARILGELRAGGGQVQESAGRRVHTLVMPLTAWLFLILMMMGMMAILFAVVAHIVLGFGILNAPSSSAVLATADTWAEWLEGLRRLGAATYLISIGLGLATIFTVLGFQAVRVRELPSEPRRTA